jgi:hypothetical protein
MNTYTSTADRDLIKRIDAACGFVETAKAAWFDRSVELGKLLREAKQCHPKLADFEAFLKETKVGINMRWAYECIAMAGDPKEAERLRTANKDRVKKHRERKRLNRPKPKPKPKRKPEPASEAEQWLIEFCNLCFKLPELTPPLPLPQLIAASATFEKARRAAERKINTTKKAA